MIYLGYQGVYHLKLGVEQGIFKEGIQCSDNSSEDDPRHFHCTTNRLVIQWPTRFHVSHI